MNPILIQNGRVIDPESNRDEVTDILVVGEMIEKIGKIEVEDGMEVIDAKNLVIIPGVIDLHVHLRDMEQADKETIESGTLAARKGGVTTVFAMPNTSPTLDSSVAIERYQELTKKAHVETHLIGAITVGLGGQELAALEDYTKLGLHQISDDGRDVDDEGLLERAYLKAKELGLLIITHPEMHSIAPEGVINEGKISQQLGVPGQPNEKEWKAVERGLKLALKLGVRAHFTHVSTKESIELIRQAKKNSDLITCDVTPHHFSLTEERVLEVGSLAKVNPPLRAEEDRLAVIEGIKDGTVDLIATDHAPHREQDKTEDLKTSAFGISQLETSLASTITELHFKQGIPLIDVIRLMMLHPAQLTGLRQGRLKEGHPADLVLVDLMEEKKVDRMKFISKGRNTPFEGMILRGWPRMTMVRGVFGGLPNPPKEGKIE